MKRMFAALLIVFELLAASALASVSATPNQRLAFRTGPNTKYVELYTLPQETQIRAIEYESGNGVTWVLVEYTYQGERCRAYTGLKRMTVNGSIPWASHYDESRRIYNSGMVYAAPTTQGAYRGYVYDGEWVTLLDYEGDYAFIEFSDGGTPCRGYVPTSRIASGSQGGGSSDKFDLDDYGYRTVDCESRGSLVFQTSPGGSFIYDYRYRDGDRIYVNLTWRQNGYAIAYSNGVYGYVDASYIDWDSGNYSYSTEKDLSNFEYRYVATNGRGTLVFQKTPGGTFMSDYKFRNGDRIYVNVYWRQNGYAIAYKDGVYGYVDASYIDW